MAGAKAVLQLITFGRQDFPQKVLEEHFPHSPAQLRRAHDVLEGGNIFDHGLDLGVCFRKPAQLVAEVAVEPGRMIQALVDGAGILRQACGQLLPQGVQLLLHEAEGGLWRRRSPPLHDEVNDEPG